MDATIRDTVRRTLIALGYNPAILDTPLAAALRRQSRLYALVQEVAR